MENIIESQFTILGMRGSGKTCYLLGFYKVPSARLKGFAFYTDYVNAAELERDFRILTDNDLSIGRFPPKTDDIKTYKFDISYLYNNIMNFSWIDYPGGLLINPQKDTYENLGEHILNSQILFICLDGDFFKDHKNNSDIIDLINNKCSGLINNFLNHYSKINKYLPPICILITKYDLCNKIFTKSDYEVIVKESFGQLFTLSNNDNTNRFVSVIPVSLGNEISMNNYTGNYSPINIEIPMFMATWFTLKSSLYTLEKEQIKLSDTMANVERKKYIKDINDCLEILTGTLNKNIEFVYFNGNKSLYFQDAAENYIKRRYTNES